MQDDSEYHLEYTAFDLYSPCTFQETVDTSFWYRLSARRGSSLFFTPAFYNKSNYCQLPYRNDLARASTVLLFNTTSLSSIVTGWKLERLEDIENMNLGFPQPDSIRKMEDWLESCIARQLDRKPAAGLP